METLNVILSFENLQTAFFLFSFFLNRWWLLEADLSWTDSWITLPCCSLFTVHTLLKWLHAFCCNENGNVLWLLYCEHTDVGTLYVQDIKWGENASLTADTCCNKHLVTASGCLLCSLFVFCHKAGLKLEQLSIHGVAFRIKIDLLLHLRRTGIRGSITPHINYTMLWFEL